jgi:hypothetical protein
MNVGTTDPSAASGIAAPLGTLGVGNDGAGLGRLYVKTAAADTGWTLVVLT